mmetsp:Transcript_1/g.3  ORF Transcript_1/g.3 Transcript_1/m.3 type:complete len:247 (+) Transcript_1:645-1385(+)
MLEAHRRVLGLTGGVVWVVVHPRVVPPRPVLQDVEVGEHVRYVPPVGGRASLVPAELVEAAFPRREGVVAPGDGVDEGELPPLVSSEVEAPSVVQDVPVAVGLEGAAGGGAKVAGGGIYGPGVGEAGGGLDEAPNLHRSVVPLPRLHVYASDVPERRHVAGPLPHLEAAVDPEPALPHAAHGLPPGLDRGGRGSRRPGPCSEVEGVQGRRGVGRPRVRVLQAAVDVQLVAHDRAKVATPLVGGLLG